MTKPEYRSADFQLFYESFFEQDHYQIWRNGVNTDALGRLKGDERAEAERLLLNALDSPTWHIATGLAELRSPKAVPRLKELLSESERTGEARVKIALALWEIDGYPEAIDHIIDVLHPELGEKYSWGRTQAALVLSQFPIRKAADALLAVLHDPHNTVRSNAAASLLVIAGTEDDQYRARGHRLAKAMWSEEEVDDQRQKATAELRDLIAATTFES